MKKWLFSLVFIAFHAGAIPEENFMEIWHQEALPYFASGQQRTFINPQGMKLNFHSFQHASLKKTLVILPGRTEPALKYSELIYDLKDKGFNIYILDHQGQGASERLLSDSHKGYVRHFKDYVRDFTQWMDEVVLTETPNTEYFLLAHSMGGAIGVYYLSTNTSPFKKAVFSAPMMEINTKPYSENMGRFLSTLLTLVGQGKKYAPNRGPYIAEEDTFEKNEVTHSEVRFLMNKNIFIAHPELALGGPTSRWVSQSLKATKKIHLLASKIKIPVLMFQSGLDLIVKPASQNQFCERHFDCRKIFFPDAHHEILMEKDVVRDHAIEEILRFFR